MTSFLATTLALLADQPETISAVLSASRQMMNCSAVAATLSTDETWDSLCLEQPEIERKLLQLFSIFSDTMQFTEKLRIQNDLDKDFVKGILENLIKKRYFSRTIRLVQLPSADALIEACSLHSSPTTTPILFSNLRFLSIKDLGDLQDEQLKPICSHCPFLENLNIPRHYDLTDKGVESLSTKLKHLKTLELQLCSSITDSGLQHLIKLPSLQTLDLCNCDRITDDGFQHLANLPSLLSLSISWCDEITDRGLEHFAKLSSLQTLNLEGCNKITDNGLQHLAKLASLRSLNLGSCNQITDIGLQHLAKLPSLQSLNLSCCNNITREGCRVFAESTKIIR